MKKPAVLEPPQGFHNADLQRSAERLRNGKGYRDLSTVCVTPTPGGVLPIRVVSALRNLMTPMNQRFVWIPVSGMEVGQAYESAVETILNDAYLSKFKYLLCFEHDNLPPSDGLLKLYESIDDFAVVGGLYWTKGYGGQPMIYGNPEEMPRDFRPQVPIPEAVQECNGTGMGFTLFSLSIFPEIGRPWFKSQQEVIPGKGAMSFSQDLFFYNKLREQGYRVAVDTRVKVGHLDVEADFVW